MANYQNCKTKSSVLQLLPILILLVGLSTFFQPAHCYNDQGSEFSKGDFESLNNAVYDVSASRYNRAIQSSRNYPGSPKFPKPRRLTIKVEDQSSSFMQCGGFSSGSKGTCCTACFQLNYNRGCYCRSWDCLCFDS